MNHRQAYAMVVCFLVLFAFTKVTNAQSSDRDNPTPLTSNKISSPISTDDSSVYYRFEAGPGEVTATLNVEPDLRGHNQVTVYFLLSETGKRLVTLSIWTYAEAKEQVQSFILTRRQMVTMRVWFPNRVNSSGGRYQLSLSGAVKLGQDDAPSKPKTGRGATFNIPEDKTHSSDCLPKQGTLIIKMKDGSKKIIDLSEAETVTVVP